MAEMPWVYCYKFEVLYTLEMLGLKNNSNIYFYNTNNNKMRKSNFYATKPFGVFFDSQFQ